MLITEREKHGPVMEGFSDFVAAWLTFDLVRPEHRVVVESLRAKIRASEVDIKSSEVYAKDVELTTAEAAAFVWLAEAFVAAKRDHPACTALKDLARSLRPALRDPPGPVLKDGALRLHATPRSPQRVFLVHGRDETAMLHVDRWLRKMNLEPVTLEGEHAAGSTTVIEAFEACAAGCGTAIVLATADDRAPPQGGRGAFLPRARQNVVLELGFFWGRLGRGNVILLIDHSLVNDFPSDLAGVLTVRFNGDVRPVFDQLRAKLQEVGVIALGVKS